MVNYPAPEVIVNGLQEAKASVGDLHVFPDGKHMRRGLELLQEGRYTAITIYEACHISYHRQLRDPRRPLFPGYFSAFRHRTGSLSVSGRI